MDDSFQLLAKTSRFTLILFLYLFPSDFQWNEIPKDAENSYFNFYSSFYFSPGTISLFTWSGTMLCKQLNPSNLSACHDDFYIGNFHQIFKIFVVKWITAEFP